MSVDSLDDVLIEARPDILVMDIEGGEVDVLANASLGTIRGVAAEMHGQEATKQALAALACHGFQRAAEPLGSVWAFERSVPC